MPEGRGEKILNRPKTVFTEQRAFRGEPVDELEIENIATKDPFFHLGQTTEDIDDRIGKLEGETKLPKAIALFDGSLTGTNRPTTTFNIDTVERTAGGTYTVTFKKALSDANYVVSCTGNARRFITVDTKTVDSFRVLTENSAGTPTDTSEVNVVIFDQ